MSDLSKKTRPDTVSLQYRVRSHTIVNRNTGTITSTGISLYVEEEVHDVAVLNDVLLTFDSELSCGSAGRF